MPRCRRQARYGGLKADKLEIHDGRVCLHEVLVPAAQALARRIEMHWGYHAHLNIAAPQRVTCAEPGA